MQCKTGIYYLLLMPQLETHDPVRYTADQAYPWNIYTS